MSAPRKTALVVVADGSESLEAVTLINVLRRANVDVTVAAVGDALSVNGTRGVMLLASLRHADTLHHAYDLIALPGGEAGAKTLGAHAPLIQQLQEQRRAHRWIAAICAAPALVLAPHGLLDGKQATGYPAFRDALLHYVNLPVVVDGHTITGQGPASAMAFALACVDKLCGEPKRREVADALLAA
jgi:4-methyl-5(b-hydroxyethyl)-thiazole monophosphate biosynthesis